ncbi:VOC family protein [uncultured Roseibium sp.]|uniref:VOC family protein n=1 Tax=uncultured Roseibium sp. TaxID=1936171 RepID=UPI002618D9BB|nr:VOC family protein [uncultured Roseibium sp.]
MVRGLDHVVVAVKDLDAAGRAYSELGFTVTPENRHPWGTANRLIQFDGFFIELLSVADANLIAEPAGKQFSFGAFNRDFLACGEGASMLVLESKGASEDREAFLKSGLDVYEPFSFERTAHLTDGSTTSVAFDLTILNNPLSPQIGYFTCFNKYPENFWKPDFQTHSNGARAVQTFYMLAEDPSDHHEFLGAFTGQREMRATSLGLELETPRGKVFVLSPAGYRSLLGEAAANAVADDLPILAALEIECEGLNTTRIVPANELFGLTIVLTPAKERT